MNQRSLRWLLASIVAIVSLGIGVSAASSDNAAGESAAPKHKQTNETDTRLSSAGIRW